MAAPDRPGGPGMNILHAAEISPTGAFGRNDGQHRGEDRWHTNRH